MPNRDFWEIYDELCKEGANKDLYSYEHNTRTVSIFAKEGATHTIIAVGGYRLVLLHYEHFLISITPKAKSIRRGEYVLWTGDQKRSYGHLEPMGEELLYDSDPMGPMRLQEAMLIAFCAWQTSCGNVEKLYKVIGNRGFCAICGAGLTDELSLARGIGPECIKKVDERKAVSFLQEKNNEHNR